MIEMESLRYDDEPTKQYPEAKEELRAKFPEATFEGKPFEVDYTLERGGFVIMTVDGEKFTLTQAQANDLSYALARASKRIDKKRRKAQGR
jgi:hypothetical protein